MESVAQHHREALSQQTSIIKLAENFGENILEENLNDQIATTKKARKVREKYSKKEERLRKERWKQHRRAGKYLEELEKDYIDKEGSLQWLKNGDMLFSL